MADDTPAGGEFVAVLLDGSTSRGALVSVSDESVTLRTAAGEQSLKLSDLLSLARTGTSATNPAGEVLIDLFDGSHFLAQSITTDKQSAEIALSNVKLTVPLKALRTVRWQAAVGNAQNSAAWNEFADSDKAGDLLVIRKSGALDAIDGVVGQISAESVEFTLDGDTLTVKLPRVEGIVFARTAAQEAPEARCVLHLNDGSRWNLASWKSAGEQIQVTAASGFELEISLAEVAKFDFSYGKLTYLSDLTPEKIEYRSYFAPQQELPALQSAYLPRSDRGVDGLPLVLDGKTYAKGLAMYSRGVLVYKLPPKMATFTALVGIADRARGADGNVQVSINGDGKTLWQGEVHAKTAAIPVQCDVRGIKRLELIADYGSGQDVGDHLLICDAKVTK